MPPPAPESPLAALDDEALVRRVLAGDGGEARPAEDELCRRFAPRVRVYGLRHLRRADDAEELVQQVLLVLVEALRDGRLREPGRVASFVLGTARNKAREHGRRERRWDEASPVEDRAAADPALDRFDLEALKGCLEDLAERERSVVVASFFDLQGAGEIGARLATSAGNVRVIRHRALRKLGACLGLAGFGEVG